MLHATACPCHPDSDARVVAMRRYTGGSFKRVSYDSADMGWTADNIQHHGGLTPEQSLPGGIYGAWLVYGLIPAAVLVILMLG